MKRRNWTDGEPSCSSKTVKSELNSFGNFSPTRGFGDPVAPSLGRDLDELRDALHQSRNDEEIAKQQASELHSELQQISSEKQRLLTTLAASQAKLNDTVRSMEVFQNQIGDLLTRQEELESALIHSKGRSEVPAEVAQVLRENANLNRELEKYRACVAERRAAERRALLVEQNFQQCEYASRRALMENVELKRRLSRIATGETQVSVQASSSKPTDLKTANGASVDEVTNFAYQVDAYEQTIAGLKEDLRNQEKDLANFRGNERKLLDRIGNLEMDCNRLQKSEEATKSQLNTFESRLSSVQKRLLEEKTLRQDVEKQAMRAKAEAQTAVQELEAFRKQANLDIRRLEANLEVAQREGNEVAQAVASRNAEIRQLEGKIEEIGQSASQAWTNIDQLATEIKAFCDKAGLTPILEQPVRVKMENPEDEINAARQASMAETRQKIFNALEEAKRLKLQNEDLQALVDPCEKLINLLKKTFARVDNQESSALCPSDGLCNWKNIVTDMRTKLDAMSSVSTPTPASSSDQQSGQ